MIVALEARHDADVKLMQAFRDQLRRSDTHCAALREHAERVQEHAETLLDALLAAKEEGERQADLIDSLRRELSKGLIDTEQRRASLYLHNVRHNVKMARRNRRQATRRQRVASDVRPILSKKTTRCVGAVGAPLS